MMTDNDKQKIISKLLQTSSIRGMITCDKIYHIIYHTDFSTFQPDYNNELDRKFVNTIFSKIIVCLFSDVTIESTISSYNSFFALSELKFKIEKLVSKVSHFVSISLISDVCNDRMYIRTEVANKIKYFVFYSNSFKEIKEEVFNENKIKLESVDDNSIRFLPLTEME